MNRMWVWLVLAACGPGMTMERPDAGTTPIVDAGQEPDAGTPDAGLSPQPCHLEPQVAVEEVGEGIAFEIPVKSEAEAVLALVQPGGYWEATLTNGVLKAVVPYGARGTNTFGVKVSCRGLTVEDTVAVKVRAIQWGAGIKWAAGAGPTGREHPLMWIDPRSPGTLWLYGGFTFVPAQFTVSNDLWKFDLLARTWTAQTPMGTAPKLAGGRAAVGASPGQLWLVGGQSNVSTVTNTVATLDTSGAAPMFADVPADANAPKVALGAVVYDAPRDRLVSACGYGGGSSIHCEVRTRPASGIDPKWEVVAAQGTPPTGRYGFFHALDAKNHRLVIFGGAQYPVAGDNVNPAKDTWALELDQSPPRWVKLADARPDVVGRRNGCAALDAEHERLFVWSGTADGLNAVPGLHVLDLRKGQEKWTTLYLEGAPTPRGSCSGAYDAVRHLVLFGFGNDLSGPMVDLQPLEL